MFKMPSAVRDGEPVPKEMNQKLEAPPDFNGPVPRKCTDILFAILLIAVWIAMTYFGADAIANVRSNCLLFLLVCAAPPVIAYAILRTVLSG